MGWVHQGANLLCGGRDLGERESVPMWCCCCCCLYGILTATNQVVELTAAVSYPIFKQKVRCSSVLTPCTSKVCGGNQVVLGAWILPPECLNPDSKSRVARAPQSATMTRRNNSKTELQVDVYQHTANIFLTTSPLTNED